MIENANFFLAVREAYRARESECPRHLTASINAASPFQTSDGGHVDQSQLTQQHCTQASASHESNAVGRIYTLEHAVRPGQLA